MFSNEVGAGARASLFFGIRPKIKHTQEKNNMKKKAIALIAAACSLAMALGGCGSSSSSTSGSSTGILGTTGAETLKVLKMLIANPLESLESLETSLDPFRQSGNFFDFLV